jgi:glycosyltransferase involved in cell wall biosynthesis
MEKFATNSDSTIAFITVCKGRLSHIKETLPLIVAQCPDEIIFVDYSCPENSGDWVEEKFPNVQVIKIEGESGFCVAHGRNVGGNAAKSKFLCFIDADILIQPGFVDWIRTSAQENAFYRHENIDSPDFETWGTIIVSRGKFTLAEGYDETYRGWGGEDDDFMTRLILLNTLVSFYPNHFVSAIKHDDELRLSFHKQKNKLIQSYINSMYLNAKLQIMIMKGIKSQLPIEERQNLSTSILKTFESWESGKSMGLPSVVVNSKVVDKSNKNPLILSKNLRLILSLEKNVDYQKD